MTEALTREQILSMPAGPEMDKLVRHHVMGGCLEHAFEDLRPDRWAARCKKCGQEEGMGPGQNAVLLMNDPKPYSTDIAAAWEVVEKIRGAGIIEFQDHGSEGWMVFYEPYGSVDGASVVALSAPLAICRAALLATAERLSE